MRTLPRPGDRVRVRRHFYTIRGRVLDTYESAVGGRVTVETYPDPDHGGTADTYTFFVEEVEPDPDPEEA